MIIVSDDVYYRRTHAHTTLCWEVVQQKRCVPLQWFCVLQSPREKQKSCLGYYKTLNPKKEEVVVSVSSLSIYMLKTV